MKSAVSRQLLRFCLLAVVLHRIAFADDARPVSFRTDIAPLLQRRCAACHCEDSAKGGYRLDSFQRLQKPGDSGDAPVVAGRAQASALFKLLIAKDPDDRMPQKADALPAGEIALVERWLNSGASYDGGDPARPLTELVREQHLRPAPAHYAQPVPVTALAFNGDGRRLASNGYRELLVWDSASGMLVRRVGGLPERLHSVAWHPKRNVLAVGGGTPGQWGTVALVDVAHGYLVRLLCDLPEVVLSVAFDKDGSTLVAGCGDRTMRIFDVSTGKEKRVLRQHADWVQAVAFNPGGTLLVSASRDRTATVFSTAKWVQEAAFREHDTPILAAAFTSDGSRVITSSRGRALVWHPEKATTRGSLADIGGDARFFTSGVFGIAAGGDDGAVRLYQGEGGAPWLTLRAHRDTVQALAASPKGDLLASGAADGEVIVWSALCWDPAVRILVKP
jgi:hypothetical protein